MTDIETKEKILEAARVLFAELGYEGTSVREIAKAADVNVASLNYYFSSKEKLFHEILRKGYEECSIEIKVLMEKNEGKLEDVLVDFFRYFLEKSHVLLSHFKMMMSSQHSHHLTTEGTEDGTYGPPGGMILSTVLQRESPTSTDEDIHWALKTLFSHVTHLSIIHNCCGKTNKDIPFSSQDDLEKSIRRVTRMVLTELKTSNHKA